ncbi:Protein of unknown function [Propionibacterium freudenreichii]|nr:Protein of unknown function [Propionibacterium freudenreichii]CEI24758.1 Protein of unknown function [Propionibacterium freudenreichii]
MSAVPRPRVRALWLTLLLFVGASLALPGTALADPTPGQTWTDGWCVRGQGVAVVVDYHTVDKNSWPAGDRGGWQVHCINPASAYSDALATSSSAQVGFLRAAGFDFVENIGFVTSILGIPVNGSNFWSFSTDDAAGSPAWRRAFPWDAGTDLNGRFVGAAIAAQNTGSDAVFPITPPEYADPAPNPDPAPAPEQDAAANDAGSNNQQPAAANQQPRANNPVVNSPVGNSRVANNPAVRAASARPSASASNAATPRASSSPSPSVVWGGDATPEDAPRQGNSPARLWLLGGIGAVALGVIIWGSVMLYRMRRVDSGDPSGALDGPGTGADAGLDADSQPGTPGPDGVIPDGAAGFAPGDDQQSPW